MIARLKQSRAAIDAFTRLMVLPFLMTTFGKTVQNAIYWLHASDPYLIGDWLINYQGGFVRRGLMGEIFLQIHDVTNIELRLIIVCFQLLLYFVYFFFSGLSLLKLRNISAYVLLLFSPFLYRFQLLAASGGFRKELMFFALLSILTYASFAKRRWVFSMTFFLVLAIYPLLVMSHEVLFALLPYLIIIYCIRQTISAKDIFWIGILFAFSALVFLGCLVYSGSADHAVVICNSIGIERFDYCPDGKATAIGNLALSKEDGWDWVMEHIHNNHYISVYSHVLWLSAIAYLPLLKYLKKLAKQRLNCLLISASVVATIAVLMLAIDWGRYIYIHLVSLFFIMLALQAQEEQETPQAQARSGFQHCYSAILALKHNYRQAIFVLVSAVSIFIYVRLWYIPPCCYGEGYFQTAKLNLPLSPFGFHWFPFLAGLQ